MIMVLRNQHVLKPGDSGPAVTEIQQFLQQRPANGVFTTALRSVVATFQRQKRLSSPGREGLVGSTTLRCMLGAWPGCEVTSAAAAPKNNAAEPAGQPKNAPAPGAASKPSATGQNTPPSVSSRPVHTSCQLIAMSVPDHADLNDFMSFQQTPTTGASGKYPGCNPSAAAIAQMQSFYQYANSHHNGASRGRCWEWVWRYMMAKGYGRDGNCSRLRSCFAYSSAS